MSTIHCLLTGYEFLMVVVVILGIIYEPVLAKWEEKQKEKVLRALKERKALRK